MLTINPFHKHIALYVQCCRCRRSCGWRSLLVQESPEGSEGQPVTHAGVLRNWVLSHQCLINDTAYTVLGSVKVNSVLF